MYTIVWKKEIPSMILIALMFATVAITYQSLPQKLPFHWNIHGVVDNYVEKNPLSACMVPLITLGSWILMLLLPLIDPKKEKYASFERPYRIFRHLFVVIFAIIFGAVTINSFGNYLSMQRLIPATLSFFFIILGNFLGKIRQNYFVGFKLPWTLSDEDNWNKTHRLAGRLFVVAGILSLFGLLLPASWTFGLFIGAISIASIIPIVYSAAVYHRAKRA